jgi:hypothetical protein
MPRDHHYLFAKQLLPSQCFKNPDQVFGELRGPMREAFLMFLWTEVGKQVPQPLPHVDIAPRAPGGVPEVVALNVVGAEVRQGLEIVVVQMPPATEPNESWFIALTRRAGAVRVFSYERSADGEAVLAELQQNGRANMGFFPDVTLNGFLTALSPVLGVPVQGLAVPTSSPVDAVRAGGARPMPPAAPQKKSIWGPLILAILFLLPGLLTYSFALNEVMRFSDDWVVISLPLLTLAGVSLVWMCTRLLGKAGLASFGLVAVGLLCACLVLNGRIDERVTYRTNAQALSDTQRFCEGRPKGDDRAKAYDAKGRGPHRTVIFEKLDSYSSIKSSYAPEFDAWDPDPYQIQQAELVACLTRSERKVETCQYEQGASIDRIIPSIEVTLYAIESGDKIFETKLDGGQPRECGFAETFYGTSRQGTITGDLPSMGDVKRVLAPHVDP